MTTAIYYEQATGRAYQVLTGPDLGGFPDAPFGSLALLLVEPVTLPGYVDGTTFVPLPPAPSEFHRFNYVSKQWEDPRGIDEIKLRGLGLVDEFAGTARLRYITSVPGQAETYQKKELQAREWAASSFAGDAPSFIAAEASALGQDPQALASEVIGLADYWSNVKGPAIEAARRKWKVTIEAATDPSTIPDLIETARVDLGSL